jgi:cysteine desulfurase
VTAPDDSGRPDTGVVDARGMRCPAPVLELARVVAHAPAGTVVTLLSDDVAAATDVPAWARMKGLEFLGAQPATDGGTAYAVRVPENAGGDGNPSATPSRTR